MSLVLAWHERMCSSSSGTSHARWALWHSIPGQHLRKRMQKVLRFAAGLRLHHEVRHSVSN